MRHSHGRQPNCFSFFVTCVPQCGEIFKENLVDCSKVGFEMRGTCGRWMLSFHLACSFPLVPSRSFLPSHMFQVLFILHFPILCLPSYFRVPQAGSHRPMPRERGGRPPRPGPRWVPEAATPEAGPSSPAPRPARPNLRRAIGRCEKRETGTRKAGLSSR